MKSRIYHEFKEKLCFLKKQVQFSAKDAIETFSKSNSLSFYWGCAQQISRFSFNQAIGLLNRKKILLRLEIIAHIWISNFNPIQSG